MSKGRMRIVIILTGFFLVTGSLIWLKYNVAKVSPILAITFSVGLIAILGTVKQALLDLSKRQETSNSNGKI